VVENSKISGNFFLVALERFHSAIIYASMVMPALPVKDKAENIDSVALKMDENIRHRVDEKNVP
jgi:hypothetical protein